ncbi:hypothetical protein [Salinithrix halophila]|uniref:Uncharacterized protein n=1 Tax=Salinithrix halophila TaxID=1485204 RepID=A0ABV8JHB3_9BACL
MLRALQSKAYALLIAALGVLLIAGVYVSFFAPHEINVGVSVPKAYSSVDAMKKDTDLIVEGSTLSNQKAFTYKGVLFTTSSFQVKKVLKGKADLSRITILETGGYDGRNHLTVEDNRVMKPKKGYILFLKKYEGPVTDKEAYVIAGAYQGKFQVKGDQVKPAKEVNRGLARIENKTTLLKGIQK